MNKVILVLTVLILFSIGISAAMASNVNTSREAHLILKVWNRLKSANPHLPPSKLLISRENDLQLRVQAKYAKDRYYLITITEKLAIKANYNEKYLAAGLAHELAHTLTKDTLVGGQRFNYQQSSLDNHAKIELAADVNSLPLLRNADYDPCIAADALEFVSRLVVDQSPPGYPSFKTRIATVDKYCKGGINPTKKLPFNGREKGGR